MDVTVRCHICNIDVAKAFIGRHLSTELHKLSLELINEAVNRLKKHLNETTALPWTKIKHKKEFCDVCNCAHEDKISHELSHRHLNGSSYIQHLKNFAKLFFTPPLDFNEIQTNNHELTKIKKYINDVSEKYSIKHLKALDKDHLEMIAVNGKRVKISFDKFHTLTGDVYIYCQLCHKSVSGNLMIDHINSVEHVDKIKTPFPDENCITQRDRMGFCFCLLCSKYLSYVDVYQHITNDQEHKVNVKTASIQETESNIYAYDKVDQNNAELKAEIPNVLESTNILTEKNIINDANVNLDVNFTQSENEGIKSYYEIMGKEIKKVKDNLLSIDETIQKKIILSDSKNAMCINNIEQSKLEATRIESNNTLNHVLQSDNDGNTISCRVCLVKLSKNVDIINEHLNGAKHKKKYKKLLLDNKLILENNEIVCQACEHCMCVGDTFDHITSETHLNKIHSDKLFTEKANFYEDGTICSICDANVSGVTVNEHESGRQHQIMIKEITATNILRTLCQSLNAPDELQHDEIDISNQYTELENYIDLITREYPANHKIIVLNHVYLEIIATNGDNIIISKDQFHTFNVSAKMGGCYLCGIVVNGPENIKLHINSEAHKRNAMVDFEDRHCIRRREGTTFSFPHFCLLCQSSVHGLSVDNHKNSTEHLQEADNAVFSIIDENFLSNSNIIEPAVKLVCHPKKPLEKPSTSKQVSQGVVKKPDVKHDSKYNQNQKLIIKDKLAVKKKVANIETHTNNDKSYAKVASEIIKAVVASNQEAAENIKLTTVNIKPLSAKSKVIAADNKVAPINLKVDSINNDITTENKISSVENNNVAAVNNKVNIAASEICKNEKKLNYQLALTENPREVLCKICSVLIPRTELNINTHLKGLRHVKERKKFCTENNIEDYGDNFLCVKCNIFYIASSLFNHIEIH